MQYLIVIICVFIISCANNVFSSYNSMMSKTINSLSTGNLVNAKQQLSNQSDLLLNLEYGTISRLSEDYKKSNEYFSSSQSFIDQWVKSYHNEKLGRTIDTTKTVLINDKVLEYEAKDYEKVMIPTYKSLNYFAMGDYNSSRIEITRMYLLEEQIEDFHNSVYAKTNIEDKTKKSQIMSLQQVEKENKSKYDFNVINNENVLSLKNSYQNAFSHYIAGFIFEALGEVSLSRPGYIKSLELSPNNTLISNSIKNLDNNLLEKNISNLLIIVEKGHAPLLRSVRIPIPYLIPNSCFNLVSVSFPELLLEEQKYNIDLSIDGKENNPVLFTDFNLMSARYIHDALPNIYARNALRLVKDAVFQQALCKNYGGFLSLVESLGSIILNQADERTWATLPSQILLTRLKLKFGNHVVKISSNNNLKTINLNLNQKFSILTVRVIGSAIYIDQQISSIN